MKSFPRLRLFQFSTTLIGLLTLVNSPGADAAVLYTVGGGGSLGANEFGFIDTSTRVYTPISSLSDVYYALTPNSAGTLYAVNANNPGSLFTITTSGTVSPVGLEGAVGTRVSGASFDPSDTLYAFDYINDRLVTLSTTTGSSTVIGSSPYQGNPRGDMAYHKGTLYGAFATDTSAGRLMAFDVATGGASSIGSTDDIFKTVHLASDQTALFGVLGSLLYSIDPATAAVTTLGTITTIGTLPTFTAAASLVPASPVPEPREYALLTGLALAGFALARRIAV